MFAKNNKKVKFVFAIVCSITALCAWQGCNNNKTGNSIPDKVSYNYHIRPILSDKCFACHGPDANKREAGLRLDIMDSAYAPLTETKGAFAIVPGKPEESELIKRITSPDPSYQMPTPESHLGILSEREKELFAQWIKQGAVYEKHWAFISPVKTILPEVKDKRWVKNEIDYFTLAKMKEQGLAPNEETDKERLLKRVSLDITGLLPSVQLTDAFIADESANAYEKIIDTLLATKQYGEKMALHWLDVARYADSYGYQDDNIRTQWPYRDWVIYAFNKNMRYDEFITWQLSGDMLPQPSKEQILATAFLRNHKYTEEGGVIPEEYRVEYIIDKVKTYSKGILALTAECAQCHDHKYDPISQKEYYQLFGFFNTSKELGFEGDVSVSKPAKQPVLEMDSDEVKNILSFINKKDTGKLTVSVMGEADTAKQTYLLNRGLYDQHGDAVRPAAFNSIMKFDSVQLPANRNGLAQWTVSRNNPLTARVFVNQLWQEFFGKGIVKTTGDFGMQGSLPSHPELLDWLAVDFMEHQWDIKRLIKQIVLSATYRQSSVVSKKQLSTDPENIYLSRFYRTRLKAELIRDVVLSTSGLLNKEIGGPSVKPYQPPGLWEIASPGRGALATYKQDHGNDLYRRGIYTFIKLTLPPPSLAMFDASNRDQCEVKRLNTSTPLQALAMMNDPTVLEAARVFAQNLVSENNTAEKNIEHAFRTIICLRPTRQQLKVLTEYYQQQLEIFTAKKIDAAVVLKAGEYEQNEKAEKNSAAALMKVITIIYNMEEAITKT
jgi:Protein of unknown function (DUF1553)/Protein of unknown function (DUF1549)/Planctomycete cytochrome C